MPVSRFIPLFLLFISLLFSGQVNSQEIFRPYDASNGPVAALLGFGTGALGVSSYFGRKVKPLTDEQIRSLDPANIWGIDRYSLGTYSLPADEWTDKLLLGAFASPFFVLLGKRGRDNFNDISLIVFEGALINAGLNNMSKVFGKRARPYNYNPDVPNHIKKQISSRYSFYSGHAATSAFFSITAAKLYNDLYPDSKARPYVWAVGALIPALVSYGRMRGGRHFFTDVLTGFIVGSAVAIAVPELNKRF